MKCDEVIRELSLYGYGELEPAEEDSLENHLEACVSCRTEWARQKAVRAAMDHRRLEPGAALLSECRQELTRALYRESVHGSAGRPANPWGLFREAFAALLGPGIRFVNPTAAVALLALGYFAARFTSMPNGSANLAGLAPDAVMSRVRSVQPDDSGSVQIVVDETRSRAVSGRLDDPGIRQLLLAAAREESNPGLRVETVDLLKDHGANTEIRHALLEAVEHDTNPGVRLKALEGLKKLPSDPQIKKTLTQVLLKDDNPGVRIQVIDLLMSQRDDSMVGVLQTLVGQEENSYVRNRCRKALQEMNASVGTF